MTQGATVPFRLLGVRALLLGCTLLAPWQLIFAKGPALLVFVIAIVAALLSGVFLTVPVGYVEYVMLRKPASLRRDLVGAAIAALAAAASFAALFPQVAYTGIALRTGSSEEALNTTLKAFESMTTRAAAEPLYVLGLAVFALLLSGPLTITCFARLRGWGLATQVALVAAYGLLMLGMARLGEVMESTAALRLLLLITAPPFVLPLVYASADALLPDEGSSQPDPPTCSPSPG